MNIAISLFMLAQISPPDTIPLSLGEAMARAADSNPTLLAEQASARSADRRVLEATQAFLPALTLGAQGLRTTDPVAVFGLKLRQETFGEQDLGLDALNRPDAFVGYSASATVELPVFAPEGIFGFVAARSASKARSAAANRAAGATRFFVARAYWHAQFSARQLEAFNASLASARANAVQAEALQNQGMVTGLDARLARIHAAGVEVRLLAAAAEADNALSSLRALLALPESTPLLLTDPLTEPLTGSTDRAAEIACATTDCALAQRGDIAALRFGVDAAKAAVNSAWGSNLPSIGLFGSVERYAPSSPWGDGSAQWTVGVGARWTPFRGLAGVGALGGAKADREAAEARLQAAEREAQVEVLRAERFLTAAQGRVEVASTAEGEARTALDQADLRYRTGISSITELLDVQTTATAATLSLLGARHDLLMAQAALDFAYGVYDR